LEFQDLVESPSFSLQDLDLPEEYERYRPSELPDQISLLEVECFEIAFAKCVLATYRHRSHGGVHYSAGLFVLFDECFWMFQLEVEEGEDVGGREGAVARRILDRNMEADLPLDSFDPYDRIWDGLLSIDDDPLTRMRFLITRLRDSIHLGDNLMELAPFSPDDD
jgi:hypothetical protein